MYEGKAVATAQRPNYSVPTPMVRLPPIPGAQVSIENLFEKQQRELRAEQERRRAADLQGEVHRRVRVNAKAVLAELQLKYPGLSSQDERVQAEIAKRETLEATYLRRLNAIARAIPDDLPKWNVPNVPKLSDAQVAKYAQTGRWIDLSKKVTLDWGYLAKAEALSNVRDGHNSLKTFAETAKSSGLLKNSLGTDSDGVDSIGVPEWIGTLLLACDPGIKLPDLQTLAAIAQEILGAELINLISSTIPFLSTITGSLKAANEVRKAVGLQLAKSGAVDASDRLRPGTPDIACVAVIEDLEYYRNVAIGKATLSAANAIASIFEGGIISGPLTTLASLSVSVHGLYRAYQEKQDFEELMKDDPYKALKRSGTVSAYVLVNYPAIGLMDPNRAQIDDLEELVFQRFGFLWEVREAPLVERNLLAIRLAGAKILDASRLTVTVA